MGLIKAAFGAIGGTLADQWKEYIYCDSLPNDVLVVKAVKEQASVLQILKEMKIL